MCLAVALLAGCERVSALEPGSPHVTTGFGVVTVDPGDHSTNTPTARVPADFKVQRRTWGGMCAGGPCGSTLTVTADGTWVYVSEGKRTTGTLSRQQVVNLFYAVRVTQTWATHPRASHGLAAAKQACAADHDGTSAAYAWTLGGVSTSVSSCDGHPIPFDDAAVEMERIAEAIGH